MGVWSYSVVISRWLRAFGILCFTASLMPLAAAVCLPCYLLTTAMESMQRPSPPPRPGAARRCILILSGSKGKALHIARLFKAEGYKVVMTEHRMFSFVGSSFSKHVDAFYYLPIPTTDPQGYKAKILEIVKLHEPDLLVPIDPRTVDLDTEAFLQLPQSCRPLACKAEVFRELDNKDTFMACLHKHGIRAPRTHLVRTKQEALEFLKGKSKDYVFKPINYDDVARTDIQPPEDVLKLENYLEESGICPTRPYVVQEKLQGPEMCSVFLVVNKQLIAHTVGFSAPVYQTQNHVDCEDIVQWGKDFINRYPGKLNGWFTMDFMQSPLDGKYYPLECNPRLGTSFMLFTSQDRTIPLLQQHLDLKPTDGHDFLQRAIMVPRRKQIYYLMNVLWEIVSDPFSTETWRRNVSIMLRGSEAVFSVRDPLPFFALNFLQVPALIFRYLWLNKAWNVVDYNIGTLKMA